MKRGSLTIGQVADQAGVNAQTLRYYERRGILRRPNRSTAGYRVYAPDTVRLIRFIKRAQELGFTLDEIDELLAFRQVASRKRKEVRTVAAAKIEDVRRKISQLQAVERALRTLVDACACETGDAECPILDALEDEGGSPAGYRGVAESSSQAAPAQRDPSAKTTSATLSIEGMACERCAARLNEVIGKLHGVDAVDVDFGAKRMSVDYDARKIDVARIIAAVDDAGGFEAQETKP